MKNNSAAHEVLYGNVSQSTMMTKISVMKNREVVDQLVGEYEWTLGQLQAHDLA